VGGLRLTEPAVDLGIVMAAASALTGKVLPRDTAVFGEIGLTGEVRPVSHADQRLGEAARAGFSRVILPRRSQKGISVPPGLSVLPVGTLVEALDELSNKGDNL
jgi:DNA repair protein RadA/Sms